jgi:hypothetical protein
MQMVGLEALGIHMKHQICVVRKAQFKFIVREPFNRCDASFEKLHEASGAGGEISVSCGYGVASLAFERKPGFDINCGSIIVLRFSRDNSPDPYKR